MESSGHHAANKVLNGVSRKVVLELAEKLEIPTRETDVTLSEAQNAEELWTSSTTYCLLPVTKLNDVSIADGGLGEIYQKLFAEWCELVGVDVTAQGLVDS